MSRRMILIAVILFANAICAYSQVFVGGYVSADSRNSTIEGPQNNENNSSSISFGPRIGYFLNDNMTIGALFLYGYDSDDFTSLNSNGDSEMNILSIGLFGRYYWNVANRVSIFVEPSFNYRQSKNESTTNYFNEGEAVVNTTKSDHTSLSIGIQPAISLNLTQSIDIEMFLGTILYSIGETKSSSSNQPTERTEKINDFQLNLNLISFGVTYRF